MYLAILHTYYEVFAVAETEDEVKKRIVRGYKDAYPVKSTRQFENPTFNELNEYFGVHIHEIDPKKGYGHE